MTPGRRDSAREAVMSQTTPNEPQRRETPRNIVGLLCHFVTRLFHTDIYSHKFENSDREQKYFSLKWSARHAVTLLRQNNFVKKDTYGCNKRQPWPPIGTGHPTRLDLDGCRGLLAGRSNFVHGMAFRSRRAIPREFDWSSCPWNQKGTGNAGRSEHPQPCVQKVESTQA